jgi:hypothetical protein
MNVNFRNLAILAALVFFALGFAWMLAPNFFPSRWGVEFSYPVGLIGRRGAALYVGIGFMFFSARNAEPSSARSALVKGLIVACLTLAGLGVFEFLTSHARSGATKQELLVRSCDASCRALAQVSIAVEKRTRGP